MQLFVVHASVPDQEPARSFIVLAETEAQALQLVRTHPEARNLPLLVAIAGEASGVHDGDLPHVSGFVGTADWLSSIRARPPR